MSNIDNLAQANKVRLEIADLRKRVKTGELGIDEAILTADYKRLPIAKLLSAVPRVSEARAEKFLDPLLIRPERPTSALTDRQRQILAAAARERYPWAVSR